MLQINPLSVVSWMILGGPIPSSGGDASNHEAGASPLSVRFQPVGQIKVAHSNWLEAYTKRASSRFT